jgi:dTDP-4-amino-4,6-dideoxygalactose transaminase
MKRLDRQSIGTGVHLVGTRLRAYCRQQFGYGPEDFPNATTISEQTVSIPLSPKLSDEDVGDAIGAVRLVVS